MLKICQRGVYNLQPVLFNLFFSFFLILTGAPKMQKAHLVARLSAEFGNSFAQAVSHTTRKPKENESKGEQYHFVDDDQFQELIRRGLNLL